MTSKTSSSHNIRANIAVSGVQTEIIKRRMWLTSVTALIMLCYYVLGQIVYLSYARRLYKLWYGSGNVETTLQGFLSSYVSSWMGVGSYSFVITIGVAVTAAFAAFFFLYRSQSVDFYFSQPLTRRSQYANIYLNSFVTYVILLTAFTLAGILVAAGMGGMSAGVFGSICINYVRNLLLFIAVYNTAALAVLISRSQFMAVIVTCIFLAGDPLITALLKALKEIYYATYYNLKWVLGTADTTSAHILSPIMNHWYGSRAFEELMTDQIGDMMLAMLKYDLFTLLFAGATGAAAYYAFAVRRAEDIGPGVVHPWIKNALKFIVAIPMGITGAIAVDTIYDEPLGHFNIMSVFIMVFVIIVACVVTEMIAAGRLKAGMNSLWHILIAAVCACLVFIVYKMDLTGYDSYTPDISRVESCALFVGYGPRDRYDNDGKYIDSVRYYITEMRLDNIEDVAQIARIGEEAQRSNMSGMAYDDNSRYISGTNAVITFHMRNGRYIARQVLIPYSIDEQLMNRVIGSDEYKRSVYNTEQAARTAANVVKRGYLSFNTGFGEVESKAAPELFKQFLDCYEKDLKLYDYSMAYGEYPIGVVRYYDKDQSRRYLSYQYEVYEGYTHTIEFLRSHDMYMEPGLDTADVSGIDIYMTVFDEDDSSPLYDCDAVFAEKENIERIVPYIMASMPQFEWYSNEDNMCDVTVWLKNRTGSAPLTENSVSEYYGLISQTDIPQDIFDALNENIVYTYTE